MVPLDPTFAITKIGGRGSKFERVSPPNRDLVLVGNWSLGLGAQTPQERNPAPRTCWARNHSDRR